ncbi:MULTISPECIES: molybdopterin-dependent oxidoreductase [unclassified Adlercreutzia]|uniref:molybdopterin-containing oxidoreductase family protein n=1 Tax=unclassified Adlercreutzia TaxID=2636013 RepID=UPI0013EB45CB|nr:MULTISPECIES: molybdopterin-dependent oxidoreductase [unclassified Adlercreutzia]
MAIKKTRTQCTTCHARCGVFVYSEGDKILKVEGDPGNPKSQGVVCGAGMSQREVHNNTEGRILYPMRRVGERGSGEWERITWDEALDVIAKECERIIAEYGPEAIVTGQGTGRTSNHWHCRLNSSLGLEGWSLVPTHVCLMPHILPNAISLGIFSPADGDIAQSKTVVLWGQNPAMERSGMKHILANLKRGANLIVIDTRFHDMSKHADVALQPRPGTDGALALAFIHEVIAHGWYSEEWVENWTQGFDELAARVEDWTCERAAEVCELDADDIREAACLMGEEGPVGMMVGLGPGCMHTNAIQNGRAIACLQGLLGWIDVPGGVNVPLSFSVMLDDKITLWDSMKDPGRPELFTFGGEEHPLYKSFGRSNDPHAVFEAIITGEPRPVKMFVAIANDPLLCYENTNLTYQAMTSPNLDLVVVKDFYFSPTAQLADIVLPSCDWSERCTYDEELDGNVILAFDQAVAAPGECWDDWKFFLEWGRRIDPEHWWWKDEKEMVLWRLREFYGFDLTWDEFQAVPVRSTEPGGGAGEKVYKKYELGMLRPDGQPGFPTPSGKIEFLCPTMAAFGYDPLPDYTEPFESPISQPELAEEYPLTVITGHRVYSFFHSAWTNVPAQRKFYPDPFVVIHPEDAQTYGITDGEWVTITSPRGKIISKAQVSREVKKGVVAVPRPGWRDACPELGLPGYGWDKANGNILVPSTPAEPGYGATPMRSSLCKIEAGRGDM